VPPRCTAPSAAPLPCQARQQTLQQTLQQTHCNIHCNRHVPATSPRHLSVLQDMALPATNCHWTRRQHTLQHTLHHTLQHTLQHKLQHKLQHTLQHTQHHTRGQREDSIADKKHDNTQIHPKIKKLSGPSDLRDLPPTSQTKPVQWRSTHRKNRPT